MMSRLIEVLLMPLNTALITVQLVVFFLALRPAAPGDSKQQSLQSSAPGVLTGIGIFGTFLGIFIALLNFDVANIDKSVPALLQGMTTKFLTSVVGLGLALLFRLIMRSDRYARTRPVAGTTLGDIRVGLQALDRRLVSEGAELRAELTTLRSRLGAESDESLMVMLQKMQEAIGGSGEGTLVGQVKLLRQDSADRQKDLARRFDEFAAQVSELGSKALINALSEVIGDFNKNLTEQFGENFKELNAAVSRMVTWQQNYADNLASMEAQFRATVEGLERSRDAVVEIASSANRIPGAMELLRDALGALDRQGGLLEKQLESFSQMGAQAVAAFPIIEGNISKLTTDFTSLVSGRVKELHDANLEQQRVVRVVTDAQEAMRVSVQAGMDQHSVALRALLDTHKQSLAGLETQIREMHAGATRNWQETLKAAVDKNQDVMVQNLQNLDTALTTETQKAMDQLSQHLLGLHQRLVQDYNPLVGELRNVIELGRRLNGGQNA